MFQTGSGALLAAGGQSDESGAPKTFRGSYLPLLCPAIEGIVSELAGRLSTTRKAPKIALFKSRSWHHSILKEGGNIKHESRELRLILPVDGFPPGYLRRRPKLKVERDSPRFVRLELGSLLKSSSTQVNNLATPSASYLRRSIGQFLDTDLVGRWMSTCKNHDHSKESENLFSNHLSGNRQGSRLIHVINECLVQQQTVCEYAALSYVWGNCSASSLKCTRQNVSQLSKSHAVEEESLAAITSKTIPLTV
ncbi:hypothetical protein B0J12DRAFT_116266 [Macrophomina phaseolina]|uniref:Heterokaryon incompatibility domain-containing protein n=1 Tax=Macrophomina phaseolina TaxID=35725 RepID=A0ABQ8G908_9PEZI|nr:hypothetical protein B0J12DRAFT_116266 [Macrophomina phaseolina]